MRPPAVHELELEQEVNKLSLQRISLSLIDSRVSVCFRWGKSCRTNKMAVMLTDMLAQNMPAQNAFPIRCLSRWEATGCYPIGTDSCSEMERPLASSCLEMEQRVA